MLTKEHITKNALYFNGKEEYDHDEIQLLQSYQSYFRKRKLKRARQSENARQKGNGADLKRQINKGKRLS